MRIADRSHAETPVDLHATEAVGGDPDPSPKPRSADAPASEHTLTLSRIVHAAIELADHGEADSVSMRRTAAKLGVGVMSLYRYVSGREELNDLIVDTVFAERPLPEPGPPGWRSKLELSARQEWALYQDHPWLPQLVAGTTRPPLAPNLMAYTDWRMRAIDGHGLDFDTMVQVAIMVGTYLNGAAMSLVRETRLARETRRTRQEWVGARQDAIRRTVHATRLPMVSRFGTEAYHASEPASIFEFGLSRMLDGIAALLDEHRRPPDEERF